MPEALHPALIQNETQEILKHLKENEEIVDIASNDEELNKEQWKENL